MAEAATSKPIAEEDQSRADLYGLLSALLARPPGKELLARTAALSGDETPLGRAVTALAALARKTAPSVVEREFTALFIGLGRGELLPFASYYMTGFLNEKPLALLREEMARSGIRRADSVFEPEDSIASLMEMMSGLIVGRFGAPAPLSKQREFFGRHVAPWAAHFYADLEAAKGSAFYAPVGAIGRQFMAIEAEAFRLVAA